MDGCGGFKNLAGFPSEEIAEMVLGVGSYPVSSITHLLRSQLEQSEYKQGGQIRKLELEILRRIFSSFSGEALWGCWIVWCILTSRYLVSLLPVSIIHVSDIFLVGFWSWEISFIMWGFRGWGWQAAGTWVLVSREMVGFPAPIGWPGASQSICTQ